ncbi:phosphotransferase enzyme family protein [Actinomadura sp. BRA 177]|uniref:phosphotransferase enzyme family protein n=1 Tax=Actinomadura sp. BRA 177 TaxID=2745202 RepID=UPI0015957B18|nr:phosphotransferase [Actinomadura sp. BRA 177]NVI87511.1 phosphotransferase [Actinomadura sp. BRA 177]
MSAPTPVPPTEAITAVLTDRYDLAVRTMVQLPIGQGTINYRATCDGSDVFVKHYPPGTDTAAEQRAVALSELARHHAIPAAPIVLNRHAELIDDSTGYAVSVWEWMPGRVVTTLNTGQCARAGDVLGRIHAAFAPLPESAMPSTEADTWFRVDPARLASTVDSLMDVITERIKAGTADAFDVHASQTLNERRTMLDRIPGLISELPPSLTTQVLHGDYSPVNLLYAGDDLTAVLDFRPPSPFLVAYDLGRMAFYPNTVACDPDWMESARTLIRAYQAANPAVADADILACGRVALLQLLGSLYGVKQHYLKPGLFQDDLDEFWTLRHRTAAALLDHLEEVDQLLADLIASTGR